MTKMTDDELSAALWAYLRAGFPEAAFPGNVTQNQRDFWWRAVRFVREADAGRIATLERELAAERARVEAWRAVIAWAAMPADQTTPNERAHQIAYWAEQIPAEFRPGGKT